MSSKLPKGIADRNSLYRKYKWKARSKNREWNLSIERFTELTSSDCYYCGEKPKQIHNRNNAEYNGHYIHNGIDRKDNSLGYTLTNSLPCCKVCNRAKETMSYEDFINWIKKLKDNYEKTNS